MGDNEQKQFTKEEIVSIFSQTNKVKVVFKKKDGSIRTMFCTRDLETIPEKYRPKSEGGKHSLAPEHLVSAFDLEANGWRSITVPKVISIDPA
jgi:hypothetical protein